jgi:diaminohydroxyphosphoribosylaminopyrimidine deaminase/5-amino-6-(5-phosphoribosylamino)uracil reductase
MNDDEQFMKMALDLASLGRGTTSPNPMVGAVVVKHGKVIGKGYHQTAGLAHAEVNALDEAGSDAKNATLYVTLEPCNHHGRTPPCTERILSAGINRLVVAMPDPNPDVRGGGLDYLSQKGLKLVSGVRQQEAQELNEAFIKYITTRKPFVILKCAATLDGQIATRSGDAKWVSSAASRAYVHQLRHAVDAILVGIGTVQKDDPQLTTRLTEGGGQNPIRVILDTNLSISETTQVVQTSHAAKTWIISAEAAHSDETQTKRAYLERMGVRLLTAPIHQKHIDLAQLITLLGQEQITSLLIEGGGEIIASAVAAEIVDKIMFFYAPKILGGNDGIPICKGQGKDRMQSAWPVSSVRVHRFEEDVMIEGYL